MNNKGQAALEYLMTYGWALIVIAIVVGVLVFIVSSPAGNVVCNSSDPSKILVKASQVNSSPATTATDFGTIKLVNLTGGNLTSVECQAIAPTGAFAGNTTAILGCPTFVGSGEEFEIQPDRPASLVDTHASSAVTMTYTDYAALDRTVTITCSGPITTK